MDKIFTDLYTQKVHHFFAILYHLRKLDYQNTQYTEEVLKRLKDEVVPELLVDIIQSNNWNEKKEQMEVDVCFSLKLFLSSMDENSLMYGVDFTLQYENITE